MALKNSDTILSIRLKYFLSLCYCVSLKWKKIKIQCEYGPDFVIYTGAAGAVGGFRSPLLFFQISYRKVLLYPWKSLPWPSLGEKGNTVTTLFPKLLTVSIQHMHHRTVYTRKYVSLHQKQACIPPNLTLKFPDRSKTLHVKNNNELFLYSPTGPF